MGPVTDRPADPLATTEWLLVDGTNLLHALSKSPVAAPRSALVARMRGAVPPSVAIDVVFDGPAEPGLRGERIASGLRVRYSGGRTADDVLLSLVDEVRANDGPVATAAVLVVTDDRDLRHGLRLRGARTAGAAWLLGRLDRPRTTTKPRSTAQSSSGRAPGHGQRPATTGPSGDHADDGDDGPRWEPGRRATVKKGNPRRRPKNG
jgi:predicted RNA-binding protein with PIN domain